MPPPRVATIEEIPIIDISALLSDDEHVVQEARPGIAKQIGAACRAIGFFCVRTGPSFSAAPLFAASAAFFKLPQEVKNRSKINSSNRGYVGFQTEALDPKRGADQKEAFNIGFDLGGHDDGLPFRGENLWPNFGTEDANRAWKLQVYENGFARLHGIARIILSAIAVDLKLPPSYFDKITDKPMAILRLLFYPKCEPQFLPEEQDGVSHSGAPPPIAAGTHCDYGLITALICDQTPGLEVHARSGEWLIVPPIPDTIVVNVGDLLQHLTCGEYKSTPHRVVNRTGAQRMSIPFFMDANPNALIVPLKRQPTILSSQQLQQNEPPEDEEEEEEEKPNINSGGILASDWLKMKLDATYAFRRAEQEEKKEVAEE